jgi:hypothetical protein
MKQIAVTRTVVVLSCVLAVVACSSKESADTSASTAAQQPAASVPDACKLLTLEEMKQATGWANPVMSDVTVDRSYQSSCNFADGTSPMHYVSVSVIVGGMTHDSSAAYAQSVGYSGGVLSEPARAVHGFNLPAIETRMGSMHSMRASTPQAVELTISSASPEITRALFTMAVRRI